MYLVFQFFISPVQVVYIDHFN